MQHTIAVAEAAYLESFRALARSAPDYAIDEHAGLVLIASGRSLPMLNYASVPAIPEDPSALIARARQFYRGRVERFMLAAPPDVAPRLRELGAEEEHGAEIRRVLLIRPADSPAKRRADVAGLVVTPASSIEELRLYNITMAAAFGGGDWADAERPDFGALLAVPGAEHYVGRIAGEAVATAMRFSFAGVTVVANVGVRPEYRRRGIGEQMTWRTLDDGALDGCPTGFLQASDEGEPIYRRMGFTDARHWSAWLITP